MRDQRRQQEIDRLRILSSILEEATRAFRCLHKKQGACVMCFLISIALLELRNFGSIINNFPAAIAIKAASVCGCVKFRKLYFHFPNSTEKKLCAEIASVIVEFQTFMNASLLCKSAFVGAHINHWTDEMRLEDFTVLSIELFFKLNTNLKSCLVWSVFAVDATDMVSRPSHLKYGITAKDNCLQADW